jgi:hypothetical protein
LLEKAFPLTRNSIHRKPLARFYRAYRETLPQ